MYYVYILASQSRTLYVGMTNDLHRRMYEHKTRATGFVRQYRVDRLVYYETGANVDAIIAREKQLKRWPRWRKDQLIEKTNPEWRDLSVTWFDPPRPYNL